ncbi:MAG: PrsW family intramembrane metalloprotease [Chloroflexi bacterium]|nr:PrsW family intramembrane metalloprotease [Chloroflexota bacterium]
MDMNNIFVFVISLLASLIPTVIYVRILLWFDKYEEEPIWLSVLAFLWGALPSIFLTLQGEKIFGMSFQSLGFNARLVQASAQAPIIEEMAKSFVLFLIVLIFLREFDGVMDGITYGGLVGFGFALTENIVYFTSAYKVSGWAGVGSLVFLRTILFGLNHAVFTAVTGAGIGYARMSVDKFGRFGVPILAFFGALTLHAMHNFFGTLAESNAANLVISIISDYSGVIVLLLLIYAALQQERTWIIQELAEEVEMGILSPEDYAVASSYSRRLFSRGRQLITRGPTATVSRTTSKVPQLCAELAFKKYQYRLFGDQRGSRKEIEDLREKLQYLSNPSAPASSAAPA